MNGDGPDPSRWTFRRAFPQVLGWIQPVDDVTAQLRLGQRLAKGGDSALGFIQESME